MARAGQFVAGNKAGKGRVGPNKATAAIKALASKHGETAIKELVRLASHAEPDAAKIAAIKELLDRGFGKAAQPHTGSDGEAIELRVTHRIIKE